MDLPERASHEERLTGIMQALNDQWKEELLLYLGNPPDIDNVPAEFWDRVEQEQRDAALVALLLIYLHSARVHSQRFLSTEPQSERLKIETRIAQDGKLWAFDKASNLAADFRSNSRDWLVTKSSDWFGKPVTPDELRAEIDPIFGDSRAENIGVTETTSAITAGATAGVENTVGLSDDDLWITENDSSVCPICSPLHKTRRPVWSAKFPNGPGAHPRCRCYLQFHHQPAAQPQGTHP